MDTLFEVDGRDVLQGWAEVHGRRRGGSQQHETAATGLRFAFYGRTSTLLVRLGLGDRIVGTSAPDVITAFTGDERTQGNAEVVVNARPGLVLAISALSLGGLDGTPTPERLSRRRRPSRPATAPAKAVAALGANAARLRARLFVVVALLTGTVVVLFEGRVVAAGPPAGVLGPPTLRAYFRVDG